MRILGVIGKAVLGLGIGGLSVLAGIRALDDRHVDSLWRFLAEAEGTREPFREEMVAGLPAPARRYFLHAIRPGTPLASKLIWAYHGEIRPNTAMPWLSLTAEQIVVKERGFVWKARASKGPLVLTAADHYLDGEGRMRIALFGLVPVVNATGPDLSRSALARLLVESIALPAALLPGPRVEIEGIDERRFAAKLSLQGERTPLTLTVDETGRLKEFVMQRWGDLTDDRSFRYIPYGGFVDEERSFDGYTIPSRLRIGWWFGTDRYQEAIRLRLDWAVLS